jgi:hypothetical protein
MTGPLGVLSVILVAATTDVKDIDGGPPGSAVSRMAVATTEYVEDIDGGPPDLYGDM